MALELRRVDKEHRRKTIVKPKYGKQAGEAVASSELIGREINVLQYRDNTDPDAEWQDVGFEGTVVEWRD